ncbi:MAG: 3-phenylpropionate/cinnamic acid dioxygenase subunit beta [Acetobacteraceae bacterium]|nr:3-phenylpropionate/cinnamic acid dioxygenase subunit beta [Acetobacteraceae bacterium]MDW8397787.1 3-phenylpropionate/cinnamic acid dioxygenase subunit beta [Acetobacteraceae bacterium]
MTSPAAEAAIAIGATPPPLPPDPGLLLLRQEVEDFLLHEADLLDERRFREWLALLAEDIVYFMPIRTDRAFGEQAGEFTAQGRGISWFDEDKWTLTKRVEQILTGVHYAEEPLSRVCRVITGVRLLAVSPDRRQVTARSRFLVRQGRLDYERADFVGSRTDILRREPEGWRLARREIILTDTVLLAKNLSIFF